MKKIFIDGQYGTTGLSIYARIKSMDHLEFLSVPEKNKKDPEFKKQVKAELKSMASFYPNYLQSDEDEGIRLSENAIEILRLQDDGKNINEISEILHISVNTVKYHNSRTYRLLDVKGKIQAIKEAKRRGLL